MAPANLAFEQKVDIIVTKLCMYMYVLIVMHQKVSFVLY